ncbi:RAB6-interacting golgin-like [Portunus trituberculatus]|uniref:RAB6-interacting golgin-like n=1 Tax=Portunus trituberculatus TaxID=210409 RepID=UPI001E1CEA25|nr:RAB6-interacting golgin-like [Portunus trituberculatus]
MAGRVWAGFSEADIKQVQRGGGGAARKGARMQRGGRGVPRGFLGTSRGSAASSTQYTPVPAQARLSQGGTDSPQSLSSQPTPESSPAATPSPVPPSPCISPTGSHSHPKSVKIRLGENNSYEVVPSSGSPLPPMTDREEEEEEEDERSTEELFFNQGGGGGGKEEEGALLKNIQERQKEMEEQNKKRKELLIKAIADRSRRTQSEAQKLKQIQAELARLDSLLSSDVSILRNQIEGASQDFNEAQKRYERAEREFIEAKLQLFSRLERKELLTEHLCRIIEANERRKAVKLSELMAQLELVDCVGELPTPPPPSQCLPQLASLDEVTYAACTTLKHPQKATQALQAGLARVNGNLTVEEIRRATEMTQKEEVEEEKEEEECVGEKKEEVEEEEEVVKES